MHALNLGSFSINIVCFLHLEISSVLDAISVKGNCHDTIQNKGDEKETFHRKPAPAPQ